MSSIPIGHKEALVFFVLDESDKPTPLPEIEKAVEGKPSAISGLLSRLMDKDLVNYDVTKQQGRTYFLSRKGKATLKKALGTSRPIHEYHGEE